MNHSFSAVPSVTVPRSSFNRSSGYKTTFDSGFLIPFYADEVLPGDTFQVNATIFARLASAMDVPVMDNMFLDTHFFFVPNRLVWDNFEKFMGERKNPDDSIDYLVPQLDYAVASYDEFRHSLADYFGLPFIPKSVPESPTVCAFPFRAYNLIWNEWFRDENLQDSVPVPTDDGPDNLADFQMLRRGKRHDYFTSALPWPQKGPSVMMPLGDIAPVIVHPERNGKWVQARTASTGNFPVDGHPFSPSGPAAGAVTGGNSITSPVYWDPNGTLAADLTTATSVNVNDVRFAFQMQSLLEKDARGGTRYTEILRSQFGVVSPDARLQRPEYLGGSSSPLKIVPVPQTSASVDQPTPQGNLSAFGLVDSKGNSFSKSFVEHGWVIGLVSVRADLTYQQGIPRIFSRKTRYDYYTPIFAHLGEQGVLNKEIYATGTSSDNEVFGYQERYAEYRYNPSKITGALRSSDPTSLDFWHLSQYFENQPQLSPEFIEEDPPVDRIIAVVDEPQFVLDSYIQNRTTRAMPVYSVPQIGGRF